MALPSRLGAFMVGTAVGAAQCFYWLHEDVKNVQAALSRKIAAVSAELEARDKNAAAVRLAAQHGVSSTSTSPSPSPKLVATSMTTTKENNTTITSCCSDGTSTL